MAGNQEGDQLSYADDPRMPCQYGTKCYQKNPVHHKKYKHPPKGNSEDVKHIAKKKKLEPPAAAKKVPSPPKKQSASKEKSPVIFQEVNTVLSIPDEDDLPSSPVDERESIKQKFLVEMPDDFYSFWSFCKSLSPETPEEALKAVGLLLVGPYDVLSGKLKVKYRKKSLYLVHWRYYYDPPEFQTIIKGDDAKQYHMGYFRDDPHELPCFVASNSAAVDCSITPLAGNVFGAVNAYLDVMKEKCDPFRKIKVSKIQSALQSWAKEKDISLDVNTEEMKKRKRKVLTKTFHGAGMVVPYDRKNDLGYREPFETDKNLKTILTNVLESSGTDREAFLGQLQPIVTAANIANDECDFGASLELGLKLFSFGGSVFHQTALNLLQTAYTLLQRDEFGIIAKAHLKNRRTGADLSIVDKEA